MSVPLVHHDETVTDTDDPLGLRPDIVVVRHVDDGLPLLVKRLEEVDDLTCSIGVQVSGGLVCHDDGRVHHE